MNKALLIQLLTSAGMVAGMVAVAWWAKIARPTPPLDETAVRTLLADDFPDIEPDQVWIADQGRGAVARAGDKALVLFRLGDGYVARLAPWRDDFIGATPWPPKGMRA
ncbi:hypothetical protein P7B02_12935 [Caulobacter segnis]|uniref:hypothetical protein n=1 Tax=Caulobacter segnis TaxID=88688 RepID=UPI00241091DB|nr:hypothetical protein [Caulobacter segnis]MDG2522451.1 hypothetical protein [Caulobacter segnis]